MYATLTFKSTAESSLGDVVADIVVRQSKPI